MHTSALSHTIAMSRSTIENLIETEETCWCREGESIPTVFKGIVKITPILAKCNVDEGLPTIFSRSTKNSFGRFRVIWGDFGRRFTRKS